MTPIISDLQITIPAERYISDFRDVEKFLPMCKACKNFGSLWACPPFDVDWSDRLSCFSRVTLFATKIEFGESGLSMRNCLDVFKKQRTRTESMLRAEEARLGGLAFAFAGECLYCPESSCTRSIGLPCRHPELMRPSLEAVGFDVEKSSRILFDLPILWSNDGYAPKYLVLVSALFHN